MSDTYRIDFTAMLTKKLAEEGVEKAETKAREMNDEHHADGQDRPVDFSDLTR